MIRIDNTIKDAIRKAIVANGSAVKLGELAGINGSIFTRYFTGEINVMKPSTWTMLQPYLAPFLPEDYSPVGAAATVRIKNSESMIKYAKVILNDPDLGDDKKVMILKLYFNEK